MKVYSGVVSRKAKSGLQLATEGEMWFNVSTFNQETVNIFNGVNKGDTVTMQVNEGKRGGFFIENISVIGAPVVTHPIQTDIAPKSNGHSQAPATETARQTSITKNVVVYAIFHSPVVAELIKGAPVDVIEDTLRDLGNKVEDYLLGDGKMSFGDVLFPQVKTETKGDQNDSNA